MPHPDADNTDTASIRAEGDAGREMAGTYDTGTVGADETGTVIVFDFPAEVALSAGVNVGAPLEAVANDVTCGVSAVEAGVALNDPLPATFTWAPIPESGEPVPISFAAPVITGLVTFT